MKCPFLRETHVRYCRRSGPRILIPRVQMGLKERCVDARFAECSMYKEQQEVRAEFPPCPLLEESLMQYCAAASVTKFIPYSEAILSRCGNGTYQYCDLYQQLAVPADDTSASDSIPVTAGPRYTANHFWLDMSGEGQCHIGIDAFLARMLGEVEAVGYLSRSGMGHPAAVLTAGGVDYQVVFPEEVMLTACNLYLRAEPSRLTAQPYTAGWLFEARIEPAQRARLEAKLMDSTAARVWMDEETRRINENLQSRSGELRADGGLFAPGVLAGLPRSEAMPLFHDFCPPLYSSRGENE